MISIKRLLEFPLIIGNPGPGNQATGEACFLKYLTPEPILPIIKRPSGGTMNKGIPTHEFGRSPK